MEEILEMREEDQTANRKQIVIFQLGKEEYGINILQTKEIIKPSKITNVPNTPDYVLGVINLRGQIVPVIDLRKRFAIAATETTDKQRVITIEVRDSLIGLVVDSVNGVVWLNMNELEPAPEIAGGIEQEFIEGVGKIEDRLLVIIDLEKLLFGNDQEG